MIKVVFLTLLTSAASHVCNITLAFADKEVAMFESAGAAKQYNDRSFLSEFWFIHGAHCETEFFENGWKSSEDTHRCRGYKRYLGAKLKSYNSGKFAALPVFDTCELASAFSGLESCIGSHGKFVPVGVVSQIKTNGKGSRYVHHSV